MINDIFLALWFFAPAGTANVMAFFSGKIPFLKPFIYPVDFFLKINGKRILGNHKTIRGFIVGIAFAILVVYLQILLYRQSFFLQEILLIDYTTINPILLGTLAGVGALVGDAVKSFVKRQMGIAPGKSWVPFDQIDYIIGGIVFTWFYLPLTLVQYLFIIIVWVLIHPSISFIGYLLRLKKDPV